MSSLNLTQELGFGLKFESSDSNLICKLAEYLHNEWARNFRLSNPHDTTRIRMSGWFDESGNPIQVDILNDPFDRIGPNYQNENLLAADVAITAYNKFPSDRFLGASFIHEKWLERNGSRASEVQLKPFAELPKEEQDKDYLHYDTVKRYFETGTF